MTTKGRTEVNMKKITIFISNTIILFGLESCGWLPEQPDKVVQGSLTLTPLVYPDGMVQPAPDKSALTIPETVSPRDMIVVSDDLSPPPLDLAKANAEIKILRPPESKQQRKARRVLSSELKQTPQGLQYLRFTTNFDRLWESLSYVAIELGFTVEDRNRSKQTYYVFRKIEKRLLQVEEEKKSGVKRVLGNRESYQIYLDAEDSTHTTLKIRNKSGQDDESALARFLLVQIKAVLEQPIESAIDIPKKKHSGEHSH